MVGARWTALVVVVVVALGAGVVGCGSGESGTDVRKIALVVPGQDNEPDWTLQARDVVADFPKDLGIRVDIADAGGSDVTAVLEQVANEGNQLVIAHDSRYADAAETVAEKTDVPALVWGERADPPDDLVGGITVQDKEGGYMAGIVAVKAAITRRLGIVVVDDGSEWDLATWSRMAGGFVAGARSVDPKVEIFYEQAGSGGSATVAEARAAGEHVLEQGAQMLFILGGRQAIGAQRALEAREGTGETLFIGVVSDKSSTRHLEPSGVPYMLGSVMWDTKPAFRQAARDVRAGTFGERPYALTLKNRGVWLYVTGRSPSDAYEAAIEAGKKMARGALRVPAAPTADAVEELIAGDADAVG